MSAAPTTEEVATAPAQDVPAPEPGHKVFVGNLAYATTDEGLKALFAGVVSEILSVQLIQRGTRSAGYGFVSVSDEADVAKAVAELNKKELDGRAIVVESAKPKTEKEQERKERRSRKRTPGRRGNKAPPGEVTDAEANGEATPEATTAEGETSEAKPKKAKKPRKPRKKGTDGEAAPAESTDAAAATTDAAATSEPKPKKKRTPRPPRAPRAEGEDPTGEPSKSVVFVANLAFNVDDAALGELFTAKGIKVVSARVVRRRFGQPRRSKGYGFVDVGNEEEQQKALTAFAGQEINGREIAVKIAISGPTNLEEGDGKAAPAEASAPAAEIVAH